jgi:hypothetical protein
MKHPDRVPYCSSCDSDREALLEGAETEEERERILREYPPTFAKKRDIDGKPICDRCLDYRLGDLPIELHERSEARNKEGQ